MRRQALAGGVFAAALIAAACSEQTQERAEEAARATGAAVESAAADASRTAERASETAAATIAGDVARDAAGAGAAALETLDVKAALMADRRVDASNINVDTDHKTKTVTLKGYVPSADQRTTAAEVARAKAQGYTIDNELTVQPPAKK